MSAVASVDRGGDAAGRAPARVAAVIAARLGNPARLRALAESGLDARPDPRMEAIAGRAHRGRSPAEIVDTAVVTLAPDAPDDVVAFALRLADARP